MLLSNSKESPAFRRGESQFDEVNQGGPAGLIFSTDISYSSFGKLVVSGAGQSYDPQARGSNPKFRLTLVDAVGSEQSQEKTKRRSVL